MGSGVIVDCVIIVAVALSFVLGWRQGAFVSILSTVGVLAGLICGAALVPVIAQKIHSLPLRLVILLSVVTLLVGLGNLLGGLLGNSLRDQVRWKSTLKLDSIIGAIFQCFCAVIVLWIIAVPLATGVSGAVATGIKTSKTLEKINNYVPSFLDNVPAKISSMLDESGLPPLVSPLSKFSTKTVPAPDLDIADPALVDRLRPSVIHVIGEAEQCARRLMGSGFVLDERHVITNAHVVAGTDHVQLDTVMGMKDAVVVYYNPQLDIAVIESDDLELPALSWAQKEALSADDAIVMGFPLSGPFEASPARVADKILVSGPDIYASGRVERDTYEIRGNIRQGNSGGPMINMNGEVLGVVFGASMDTSDIGYVLTAEEVKDAIGDVSTLTNTVATGECVAN
ncbi:serine protease [Corynebacterium sp. sy017]|uniref:MarP family serine protease n=1 Tax=unclassified Corynebacterium TaxID=2624378 RepID=UPI0011872566|nr:MarP family serine protease [Corynebacterium sp. SY003]MBP3089395.1 serine protease [Corynebacterium sp. sy017]TSD91106.1 serine protease [Corynebacterium sp. SY003]